MVTFIPPYMGEEIKSNAEKKMYDVLKEIEMDDVYVLHSLGLPKHQSKLYGEIDFVVVCKRGIACLEIKGGRVECREGKWFFIDRYGVERQKPEGPFAQVTGNMFSLMTELKNRFSKTMPNKNFLVACGVVFPDVEFVSRGQEIIPEIVYDCKTENITTYIKNIFDYWENRHHREVTKLTPKEIKEIVAYLRGEFCFVSTLGERLDTVDKNIVRLTKEQAQIIDALGENRHLLIEGGAGTGKTLLATEFAAKRAAKGEKVLYLTFNKNLSNNIKLQLDANENLKVINIHALFGEYVAVDLEKLKLNPKNYFEEELPETFLDWIENLSEETLNSLKYDVLVMDEGQDIIKPSYMYSLDILLDGGFEKGKWAIFYDEMQNIYNPDYLDGMQIIESYDCTKFRLFMNCRNTIQIGNYCSKVSGIEMKSFLRENGEEVQGISFADQNDFKVKIKEILKKLRSEKVNLSEVVFLAPKRFSKSILFDTGIEVNELGDGYILDSNLPKFATIQGFKGLDAKIVILVDVDAILPENFSKFLYIAGTRARTLLYVVASENFWKQNKG